MQKVLLVRLSRAQSEAARKANCNQKDYTHAVICGEYGQLFGTETFCRKYFNSWARIFPLIFDGGAEINSMEIHNFSHTADLAETLGDRHTTLARAASPAWQAIHAKREARKTTKNSKKRLRIAAAVLVVLFLAIAASAQAEPAKTTKPHDATVLSVEKRPTRFVIMVGGVPIGKWIACYGLDKDGIPIAQGKAESKTKYTAIEVYNMTRMDDIVNFECEGYEF